MEVPKNITRRCSLSFDWNIKLQTLHKPSTDESLIKRAAEFEPKLNQDSLQILFIHRIFFQLRFFSLTDPAERCGNKTLINLDPH